MSRRSIAVLLSALLLSVACAGCIVNPQNPTPTPTTVPVTVTPVPTGVVNDTVTATPAPTDNSPQITGTVAGKCLYVDISVQKTESLKSYTYDVTPGKNVKVYDNYKNGEPYFSVDNGPVMPVSGRSPSGDDFSFYEFDGVNLTPGWASKPVVNESMIVIVSKTTVVSARYTGNGWWHDVDGFYALPASLTNDINLTRINPDGTAFLYVNENTVMLAPGENAPFTTSRQVTSDVKTPDVTFHLTLESKLEYKVVNYGMIERANIRKP